MKLNATSIVGNSSTVSDSTVTITGTSAFDGLIVDSVSGRTKKVNVAVNAGALTLSSTGNTYTGTTTVNGGSLTVSGSLSGTTAVTVNNGGTMLLSGASETLGAVTPTTGTINNSATVALGGTGSGTLKLGSLNQTETLGSLTLNSNSVLDFGGTDGAATSTNAFVFNSLSLSGSGYSVQHWTGTLYDTSMSDLGGNQDRLLFVSNGGDALAFEAMANQLNFFDDNGAPLGAGHAIAYNNGAFSGYEIVPIPEPSTLCSGLAILGLVRLRERRRLKKLIGRS